MNIFEFIYTKYNSSKPIRLIELFGGYGSQHFSLEYLGLKIEHWKLCEWAVKSIQAYKDGHYYNDNINYSKNMNKEQLIDYLFDKGISMDYDKPMTYEQIKRQKEVWLINVYNNIISTNNLVNIQQVKGNDLDIKNTDKYDYIMTYSFPCQDLSLAGKQKGMSRDSGTRSGMLWEVERILDELYQDKKELPQILLMENVPQVMGTENVCNFNEWKLKLEQLGYKNYFENLISTNYGMPQTRNRTFMISILGDYSYSFPQIIPLKYKLKDLLEDNVDEKYYLSDKMSKYIFTGNDKYIVNQNSLKLDREIAVTKTTREGNTRADSSDYITVIEATKQGYAIATPGDSINISQPNSKTRRGRVGKGVAQTLLTQSEQVIIENNMKTKLCNDLISKGIVEENDVIKHSYTGQIMDGNKKCVEMNNLMPTMTTRPDCLGVVVKDEDFVGTYQYSKSDNFMQGKDRLQIGKNVSDTLQTTQKEGVVDSELRIRKLTPKECFRLMGVKDEDYERIAKNQSDSSLYHLAGDSIVTTVLMAIFGELYGIDWKSKVNKLLENYK